MDLIDLGQFVKFIVALCFVLGLMFGLAAIMKRIDEKRHGGLLSQSKRRLRIVESIALDSKRRLMLIRRDNQEHLIILGTNGETTVETNIPAASETETTTKAIANDKDKSSTKKAS